MSIKKTLLKYPRIEGERLSNYFRRISSLCEAKDISVKAKYYELIKKPEMALELKKVVTHPDGSETKVHGLKTPEVDISRMFVKGVTTSPYGGQWVKLENARGLSEEKVEEVLEKIIKKHPIKKVTVERPKIVSKVSLNVVITDDHIGLDTNPEGIGLFPYKYDLEDYKKSMGKVFMAIQKEHSHYGTFDQVVINNLGDLEDGWDGQTTRGGHDLPQKFSNDETFEIAVDSRLSLIDKIVSHGIAKKVIMRVVTNSNHSASFALIVAKSIKKISDIMFGKDVVEVDILKQFMEHRVYGDHCFILSHGKDKKEMRGGLPHVLNDKTVNFINSYIDHYELRKYKHIHVWKGDQHRLGVTDHKAFDYYSFRAFSPISNWVGTNFGDVTKAGFSVIAVHKNSPEVVESHIALNYKKLRQTA